MKKRIAILILALALLTSMLAGCSKPAEPEASAPADVSEAPASEAPVSEAPVSEAPVSEELPPEEPEVDEALTEFGITFKTLNDNPSQAEEVPVTLPVVTDMEEPVTLYMIFSPKVLGNVEQLADDNIAWKTFCDVTGLKLDIHLTDPGSRTEQVNLMLASQEYYDVMLDLISTYNGGGDQAIADEVVLDVTDMVQEYAPNFWNKITYSKATYEQVSTTTGRLVGFSRVSNDLLAENGLVIRQDWLDELKLDKPETVDQLHEILTTFASEKNAGGAWLPGTGAYETMDVLSALNGSSDFYVKDGTVGYGLVDDEFKEYLKLMNQWYTEGLIYEDFYANTDDLRVEDINLIATKNIGLASSEVNKLTSFDNTVEGSDWVALGQVVSNVGDTLHTGGTFSYYAEMADMNITTACPCPETVCSAFDYFYTEEGSLLANYGVEGISYELDGEGKPQFTEMMTADPNQDLKTQIMMNCLDIGPYLKDSHRTDSTLAQKQVDAYDIWKNNNNDQAWVMPSRVKLTTEESEQYAGCYSDFYSYYLEHMAKFVTGEESIDEGWDAYVQTMDELGTGKCIELYQAAYDRYAQGK